MSEVEGQTTADRIAHLKKGEMAEQAAVLLTGSGWLPEPLRTPVQDLVTIAREAQQVGGAEPAMEDERAPTDDGFDEHDPYAIAAE